MPLNLFFAQKPMHINYEFKARCDDVSEKEAILLPLHPRFAGTDHQIDTYFYVPHGRLKLREGNIEHALIHYERSNTAGPKQSDVILYQHHPDAALKKILEHALGVKVVVDKKRKIYFIDNVKFHFDQVKGLGSFIEVEAIDIDGSMGMEKLIQQCSYYEALFQLKQEQYMAESYSDLLLAKKSSTT
jgi:adenylate cyclase class 2